MPATTWHGEVAPNQKEPRIRAEAEAVENIMGMIRATWVSNSVLSIEVGRNPDPERRRDAEAAGVEVFLTTDDVLLRRAGRNVARPRLRVTNPVFVVSGSTAMIFLARFLRLKRAVNADYTRDRQKWFNGLYNSRHHG